MKNVKLILMSLLISLSSNGMAMIPEDYHITDGIVTQRHGGNYRQLNIQKNTTQGYQRTKELITDNIKITAKISNVSDIFFPDAKKTLKNINLIPVKLEVKNNSDETIFLKKGDYFIPSLRNKETPKAIRTIQEINGSLASNAINLFAFSSAILAGINSNQSTLSIAAIGAGLIGAIAFNQLFLKNKLGKARIGFANLIRKSNWSIMQKLGNFIDKRSAQLIASLRKLELRSTANLNRRIENGNEFIQINSNEKISMLIYISNDEANNMFHTEDYVSQLAWLTEDQINIIN